MAAKETGVGMNFLDYIRIARPSYWIKNVFVVPGILLAFFFAHVKTTENVWFGAVLGIVCACLVASSNYVLNEILDVPSDLHHPDKRHRPIASGRVLVWVAIVEWLVLAIVGLGLAWLVNPGLFGSCLLLWIMGLLYNVPPVRVKDVPYFDVLCESINNPIRLAIGWYCMNVHAMPTLSVLMAYWMFGAFLMAIKRFAELRHIGDSRLSSAYRKSFEFYNEERLLVSILFYAALFGMFAGVFIARYRIELVLGIPFVGFAVASYFRMGFKPDSPTASPEKLWRYPAIIVPACLAFLICSLLLFIDIPLLSTTFAPNLAQ